MKLSANESLHCHMKLSTNESYDVITQTLGASAGGNAAEKISVTYHFVISAT